MQPYSTKKNFPRLHATSFAIDVKCETRKDKNFEKETNYEVSAKFHDAHATLNLYQSVLHKKKEVGLKTV